MKLIIRAMFFAIMVQLCVCANAASVSEGTLSSELIIDFEINNEIRDTVTRAQAIFELAKHDVSKAKQELEQLLTQLPATAPASLRRQLRSNLCQSDDRGETQRLLALAQQWIDGSDEKNNPEERASYLMCKSWLQFGAAQHTEAFNTLAAAHRLLGRHENSLVMAELMASRGYMSSYLGDIQSATDMLLKARALFSELGVASGVGATDLYLAHIYHYTKQNETARDIYKKLLATTEREHNETAMPVLYHSIAATFDVKTQFDDCFNWLNKGLELARTRQDNAGLAHLHLALAEMAATAKKWSMVDEYAHLAQQYAQKMGARDLYLRAEMALIEKELAQKVNADIVKRIEKLVAEFEQIGDSNSSSAANGQLIEALKASRRFEEALQLAEKLMEFRKQFAEKNNMEATERMRAIYQLDLSIEENKRLQAQQEMAEREIASERSKRQLQYTILILIVCLLLISAIWGMKQLRLRHTMQALALTDELTGLANRRNTLSYAELSFNQSAALGHALSAIVFDIDHFKSVNDSYGHAAGDAVLQRISQALAHSGRQQDRLGRTGGEEFTMVLPGANAETALQVAERLRVKVATINFDDIAQDFRVTVSLGVSSKQLSDQSFDDIILRADQALYRAKDRGRNCVELAPNSAEASP